MPEGLSLWRLVSLGGVYLGTVEQPEDFLQLGVGAGTIWTRAFDESLHPVLRELELVPPEA